MKILDSIFLLSIICAPVFFHSQIMIVNGAQVHFTPGVIVSSNGGAEVKNSTTFTNNGTFKITKNSTLPQNGNFILNTLSTISGDGLYLIEQDWINSAVFNANNSNVELYGNTQQYISTTNGTITTFNQLVLSGNGTGNNRKKTLQNVDAFISPTGKLTLNNRELETQAFGMVVLNPAVNSVTNSNTFNAEGFVSSIEPGYLYRETNTTNAYLFPVGSSDGALRYRPVTVKPSSSAAQEYAVRLNNFDPDLDNYFRSQNDGSLSDANNNYYHSIERINGVSNVDLEFFFIPSIDGDWSSTAHWNGANNIWEDMSNVTEGPASNFSTLIKNSWDFTPSNNPYVLVNLIEQLTIPNVFTPNQDGSNDLFLISAKNIKEFNLIIVNRWGNVVFESTDITNSWDGTFNNTLCTEGTYFYILKTTSFSNKESMNQGFLNLKY